MEKLTWSGLSKATLKRLINLEERDLATLEWLQVDSIPLTAEEQQQVQFVQSRLHRYRAHLMNEATLWARVIYPLLGFNAIKLSSSYGVGVQIFRFGNAVLP